MAAHTTIDGIGEDLVVEILLRLPAKFVIRSGAVRKAWRRITTHPAFLSEHARRRPLDALLYTDADTAGAGLELDALPVGAVRSQEPAVARRRRLACYPKRKRGRGSQSNYGEQYCPLLASCDGLLLFKKATGHYVVCNPAARLWAELPRLTTMTGAGGRRYDLDNQESGFYFHQPSGEYRLLCHCTLRMPMVAPARYVVLTVGADEPRWLDMEATPIKHTAVPFATYGYSSALYRNFMTPAALHGRLHWMVHPEAGLTDEMVAFDTVAETFRRMASPPVTNRFDASLLVTDGSIMASEFTHSSVDLWVLEGYGGGAMDDGGIRWELRHRVVVMPWQLHMPQQSRLVAGGDDGDVILGTQSGLAVYNVRSKTVRVVADVETAGDLNLSRRLFRESLVHHAFFHDRGRPPCLPLLRFLS